MLLVATFIVLGLGAILLLWKKDKRLLGIFNVLFAATLMQWAATKFDSNGATAIHVLTGVVVLGYLIAQFVPKKPIVGAAVSTILVLVAFFATGRVEMAIGDEPNVAEAKFVVIGIILGALAPFLIRSLLSMLKGFIKEISPDAWTVAAYPALAGGGFLIATLGASVYGGLLVGSALLINVFFDNKRIANAGVSIFALATLPILLLGESTIISLMGGDVIGGLLIGAFSVALLNKLWSGKRNVVLVVVAYGIILATIFGLAYNGKIYDLMGGIDAFVAAIIGVAIANSIKGKSYQGVSLLAPLFALGLIVPTILVNEEAEAAEKRIIKIGKTTTEDGEEVEGPTVLPMSELSGNYSINPDASLVEFELGKEGAKTKGQFKKISGSFSFPEDLSKASVNVTLKMSNFTTFNSMRDESLMSDEYFSADKYPKMSFKGTGFEEVEDGLYELKGTFTMLGKTKPVIVSMQRIELEDRIVLIGSGSLDRTEFGMDPSASEGNVVDFNYQADLSQK